MPFQPGQSGNPKGRPPKASKYASEIAAAERLVADKLPMLVKDLLKLAKGGYQIVTEKWEPAGLHTTGSGEFETPAFPDKSPEELVLVERRVSKAQPDRAALQYLIDRICGRAGVQLPEPDDDAGGPLRIIVEYGDDD